MRLQPYWDEHADEWSAYARTEGRDVVHERVNLPPFLALLPPPGRATLDVGCGEGRVGAELERRGHRVVGVDSSPRMVALARERHEAVVADAVQLPFDDASFDLAIAYMSLMNVDDLAGVVREVGRVLEPGGRFCVAVTHPFYTAGVYETDESFVVASSYFEGEPRVFESHGFTFFDRVIPFETYARAVEDAGLLVERLREVPGRRRLVPLFLHLLAVKP
jgi:ubiquinone/menaquinone biosynthesis C-methylase UbiE